MTKLSRQLTNLREKRGWTKRETAKRLGLNAPSTYGNWEYGIREPDLSTVAEIATLYDVTVDYLIGEDDVSESKKQSPNKNIKLELEHISEQLLDANELAFGDEPLKPHIAEFLRKNIQFILDNAELINRITDEE
ncbi:MULTISPECIES: helix-turn-helix domain-containing protein [Listeria]|uniref:helix-turn-helix domain-containing protein n=1 Tax=Listeria TaxID=1637 RepID=UPI000B58F02E|nr:MULTISPECIES: helix-turn-helix domain-containing protein [Listeria]